MMNHLKTHWIPALLILNLLLVSWLLIALYRMPAQELTKEDIKTLADSNNALRDAVIPLLQYNVNNSNLTIPQ